MGVRESWELFCAFNNKVVSDLYFRERAKEKEENHGLYV